MAGALLHHHAKGGSRTFAGTDPGNKINPAVARVMGEWGIDLSYEQRPL
jgi:hypothetical protein